LGIVVAVVAMLTMCRPASATELVFSFTAATLENIFNTTPGFGGGPGECGAEGQVTLLCGAYQIIFDPQQSGYFNSIGSPVPANGGDTNAAWTAQALSSSFGSCTLGTSGSTACGLAYFYADFTTTSDNSAVTLLSTNPYLPGTSISLPEEQSPNTNVTGMTEANMPSGDAFTFGFTPTGAYANYTASQISFTVVAVVNNYADAEGATPGGLKGADLEDTSFTVPEPSGLWLSLAGILVLGLHNRRRWVAGRWGDRS
jgi:hypothetical protein